MKNMVSNPLSFPPLKGEPTNSCIFFIEILAVRKFPPSTTPPPLFTPFSQKQNPKSTPRPIIKDQTFNVFEIKNSRIRHKTQREGDIRGTQKSQVRGRRVWRAACCTTFHQFGNRPSKETKKQPKSPEFLLHARKEPEKKPFRKSGRVRLKSQRKKPKMRHIMT
jgi:hypothetical protein